MRIACITYKEFVQKRRHWNTFNDLPIFLPNYVWTRTNPSTQNAEKFNKLTVARIFVTLIHPVGEKI